jgi:beta-lactamase class A
MLKVAFALLLGFMLPAAAAAQPTTADPLAKRAAELVPVLNGGGDLTALFSPAFLAAVPADQVRAVATQLKAEHGEVSAVARIEPRGPNAGRVFLEYDKALVGFELTINPVPPHFIEGLTLGPVERKGDSLAGILAELKALPGQTGLAVARFEASGIKLEAEHNPDAVLALGSSFKLFLLAELSRQVKAGERKWSDVVPLNRRSLPSGLLQDWPKGAPITLHSLAALMISRSDNTATDTLLHLLGREKVEALLPKLGIAAAAKNRPFLSTFELFAIKAGKGPANWAALDEAGRRAALAGPIAEANPDALDMSALAGGPKLIDSVEWFASPAEMAKTLNWIRQNGDETALQIMAINPGIGAAAAERFAYFGFKGGSEPGVITLNFLLKGKDGVWRAVTASWNNPAAPVDEAKFVDLISRVVAQIR